MVFIEFAQLVFQRREEPCLDAVPPYAKSCHRDHAIASLLAKRGIVCYAEEELNRLCEDVSEWSVPSRFRGFCKRLKCIMELQKGEKVIWKE